MVKPVNTLRSGRNLSRAVAGVIGSRREYTTSAIAAGLRACYAVLRQATTLTFGPFETRMLPAASRMRLPDDPSPHSRLQSTVQDSPAGTGAGGEAACAGCQLFRTGPGHGSLKTGGWWRTQSA